MDAIKQIKCYKMYLKCLISQRNAMQYAVKCKNSGSSLNKNKIMYKEIINKVLIMIMVKLHAII